jgi:hypothetical protein
MIVIVVAVFINVIDFVVVVVCVVVVDVVAVVRCLFHFHIRQHRKVVLNMLFDNSEFGTVIADFIFQHQDKSLYKIRIQRGVIN